VPPQDAAYAPRKEDPLTRAVLPRSAEGHAFRQVQVLDVEYERGRQADP
jgi:hypothetical protein